MARRNVQNLLIAAAASAAIFLVFFTDPWRLQFSPTFPSNPKSDVACQLQEPKDPTFYDEPTNIYSIDEPMVEWDKKRSRWFQLHPAFSPSQNRLLLVTGTQPLPCGNPLGDHYMLRLFKNKVDYCRIHGYDIFYNNAFFHPKMRSYWSKLAGLRASMVAHPEAEWLFWVDSDAIFTDMDLAIPLERYKDHNLVLNGWPDLLANRSWLGVNVGVFLIRNCQWSMELLDVWGEMGPKSPNYLKWGEVLRSTLSEKTFPDSDDQSALVYQMLDGERKWRERIYVETEYSMSGYWLMIVGKFEEWRSKYAELEKGRRHAEAAGAGYAAERRGRAVEGGWVRPFITHFTGCQPCGGDPNPAYEGDSCTVGMERALNFADNQVLRNYGFVHPDLGDASLVSPLSSRFDQGN